MDRVGFTCYEIHSRTVTKAYSLHIVISMPCDLNRVL